MNVTRGIVTDLLPAYFSGEASEDTRQLVEDFFRQNPDFEKAARAAAKPLETLRAAAPATSDAEKEKRELQCIGWELRSRRLWLVLALLCTVWSFAPMVSSVLAEWLGAPHTQAGRIGVWSAAAVLWILYVIRPQRRQVALAGAFLLSLGEVLLVLVHLNIVRDSSAADRSGWAFIATGALATFCWIVYFRWPAQAEGSTVTGELRWRRTWLVGALLFTVWSFAPMVSSVLAEWLAAPHTQAGRIFAWSAAALFWILYVKRPRKGQLPLSLALILSCGEVVSVLVHLNVLRDSSAADRSVWAPIFIGANAALCWIVYFRWLAQAEESTVTSRWRGFRKRRAKERKLS